MTSVRRGSTWSVQVCVALQPQEELTLAHENENMTERFPENQNTSGVSDSEIAENDLGVTCPADTPRK